MSLCIESLNGNTVMILERGCELPISMQFEVDTRYQTLVDLHIVQGEGETNAENQSVAKYQITVPSARISDSIIITLHIRASGTFTCAAQSKETGEHVRIIEVDSQGKVYCEGPRWLGCTPDRWAENSLNSFSSRAARLTPYLTGDSTHPYVLQHLKKEYRSFIETVLSTEDSKTTFYFYLNWSELGRTGSILYFMKRMVQDRASGEYEMIRHVPDEAQLAELLKIKDYEQAQHAGDSTVIVIALSELITRGRIDYRLRQFALDAIDRQLFVLNARCSPDALKDSTWLKTMQDLVGRCVIDAP